MACNYRRTARAVCRSAQGYKHLASRHASMPFNNRARKLALDRVSSCPFPALDGVSLTPRPAKELVVSVLEASATSREAKGYLQKYASDKLQPSPNQPELPLAFLPSGRTEDLSNVAIVTLRAPQHLCRDILSGVGKTLVQIRALGLLAIVILDCGPGAGRQIYRDEAWRLSEAIDASSPNLAVTKVIEDLFAHRSNRRCRSSALTPSIFSDKMRIDNQGLLEHALKRALIVVAPSLARSNNETAPQPAEAHEIVLTLTKHLIGMQFQDFGDDFANNNSYLSRKIASVERLIVLDSRGGIPMPDRPDLCHRLINLEQEYTALIKNPTLSRHEVAGERGLSCAANLALARDILSLLPPSSSALFATPLAAAVTTSETSANPSASEPAQPSFGFAEMVTTRRLRNPVLHNLLTDRPASSPSLPPQRFRNLGVSVSSGLARDLNAVTLIKRGMPVTMIPDPRARPWQPFDPSAPHFRLTDTCIDLPRLVHLIEDSFNRKLDVHAYLSRVNDSLAGIVIAGEYEGGAIFTWERPPAISKQEAFDNGRLVPYLDKFAVLKQRQGSGSVADIIFNAMVHECLPQGVCWRSQDSNPVNKWYFERSAGESKLQNSGWTMFWTTLGLSGDHPVLADYEAVCRHVEPTWADHKHSLE